MKKLIIQLIKFGVVGVVATLIDLAVLMVLKEVMKVDVLTASAVAFCVSVIANYILSMLFVFKGSENSKVKEFIVFVALSIGGLLLNQFIIKPINLRKKVKCILRSNGSTCVLSKKYDKLKGIKH